MMGLALATISVGLLTQVPVDGHYFWDLFPAFVLGGTGLGFSFVPVTIASLAGVERADAGVASGLVNTSRQIGGAIGLAAISTIAASAAASYAHAHGVSAASAAATVSGFQTAFVVLGGLLVAGVRRGRGLPPSGAGTRRGGRGRGAPRRQRERAAKTGPGTGSGSTTCFARSTPSVGSNFCSRPQGHTRPASSRRPARPGSSWQSSSASPIVGVMRATSEHERKLDAPAGFRLPPLGGQPLEPRVFTSVYYDVPGGSLAAVGITLRRRTENGRERLAAEAPGRRLASRARGRGRPGTAAGGVAALSPGPSAARPARARRRAAHAAERRARRAQRDDRRGDRGRGHGAGRARGARPVRRGRGRASLGAVRRGSTRSRTSSSRPAPSPGRAAEAVPRARPTSPAYAPDSALDRGAARTSCARSCARSSGTTRERGSAATPRASTTCASRVRRTPSPAPRGEGAGRDATPPSSTGG